MSAHLQSTAAYEAGLIAFVKRQLFDGPKTPSSNWTNPLPNRAAIVTGANGGLGFEVARQLCTLGLGKIILTARSKSKGDPAVAKLQAEFPKTVVELELLDMTSYDSIRSFAERVKGRGVDMALLNAGIQMGEFQKVESTGWETDLQVNYISAALLSLLLLPTLKAGKKENGPTPVLSIVASDTAYFAKFANPKGEVLASFNDEKTFSRMGHYSASKLLDIMFIETLAEKVGADQVLVNTSNPGLTAGTSLTETGKNLLVRIMKVMSAAVARKVEVGAAAVLDAVVVGGEERHGSYLSDWTEKPYPPLVYTEDGKLMKETLWRETMRELEFAGVQNILNELRA